MKSLFSEKFHRSIYIFALILLVIGLSTSKFLMSLSQLMLAANWLLEGNVRNKFISFFKNKPALIISSILLLHFIGLIYTSDFGYGFKDIRIKSPLFILPVIIATSQPLPRKLFDIILQFFIAATLFGTVVCTVVYMQAMNNPMSNIAGISIFISHIIFSLLICVSIFVSGYFFYNSTEMLSKVVYSALIVWFMFFLVLLKSLTGLIVLPLSVIIYLSFVLVRSPNLIVKYGGLLLLIGVAFILIYTINSVTKQNNKNELVDFSKLDKRTSKGNIYQNDTITRAYEMAI